MIKSLQDNSDRQIIFAAYSIDFVLFRQRFVEPNILKPEYSRQLWLNNLNIFCRSLLSWQALIICNLALYFEAIITINIISDDIAQIVSLLSHNNGL